MGVVEGRTWTEMLSPPVCWQLMATHPIGRLAVIVDGVPEIFPVNYAVKDDTIVFRTDPGSKLRGLIQSPVVSFEVDMIDFEHRTGWSVLVKGRAEEISDAAALREISSQPLDLWIPAERSVWIRIRPGQVSGRKIRSRPSDDVD